MTRLPTSRLLAGACLLVAALLSLAGAAAGPVAHLRLVQQETQARPDGGRLPDAPAPHAEEGCIFCHTLAQHPLPGSGAVGLAVRLSEVRDAPETRAAVELVFTPPTRARAPPHPDPIKGGRA